MNLLQRLHSQISKLAAEFEVFAIAGINRKIYNTYVNKKYPWVGAQPLDVLKIRTTQKYEQ